MILHSSGKFGKLPIENAMGRCHAGRTRAARGSMTIVE
jgi:hypothetical protein